MIEFHRASPVHHEMGRLYIVVPAVAPCPHTCSPKAHIRIRLTVKQPVRNIISRQILKIAPVLKILREQTLSLAEAFQHLPGLLALHLKRDHDIRFKIS